MSFSKSPVTSDKLQVTSRFMESCGGGSTAWTPPGPDAKLPAMSAYPTELFLNGQFQISREGRTMPQINPATEEIFCEVSAAGVSDVQAAVEGAQQSFVQGWRDLIPRR